MAKIAHLALIGLLLLSGVLMIVAMIPLILLLLIGLGLYALTTRHSPGELTRRTAFGSDGAAAR